MMRSDLPKYSQIEIERRWDVLADLAPSLLELPFREIEDLYFTGTRLRLRRIMTAAEPTIYKLCKKYGPVSPYSEPITNIYLTENEYASFQDLPAEVVKKRRYSVADGSLDLFSDGQLRFEKEFATEDEALNYTPPKFAGNER